MEVAPREAGSRTCQSPRDGNGRSGAWPPEGGLGPLRGWRPLWHHPKGCWLWPVTERPQGPAGAMRETG